MRTKSLLGYILIVGIVLPLADIWGAGILDTKHNLSVTGPGPIKSTVEEQVCVFCHTPHKASTDVPYLWNRSSTTLAYTTYESSTLYARVGQPSGASKMCLSCHDGTIALGAVLTSPVEIPFAGGIRFLPEGTTKVGLDISDDHPVSFLYDETLATSNSEIVSPSTLINQVTLDKDGLLQCTACHDPHEDVHGKFLVMPNSFSALCTTCHDRTGWAFSSHSLSPATWNGAGSNPWPHTTFTTVDENACENCHNPHTAGGHARLLNYAIEEDNCLVCHSGNVAAKDIEAQLTKPYRHPVQDFTGVHDAAEDFTGFTGAHAECVDCHNPHRANGSTTTAPLVSGALEGVKGVNSTGVQVTESTYLYEVCFKCHADNNVVTFAETSRVHEQINSRLEFDITNPSFHPVEGIGQNPNVPSLLPPYTVDSIIYCTDCHNSDDSPANGGIGATGPHGSINKHILERNYTTADNTVEDSYEYALCYKCHDRDSIRADESFGEHKKHVEGEDTPCSACHDPHGVSSTQGNATNNSHLINFDINIVSPNSSGLLQFEDLGMFRGRCFLSCHGEDHDPKEYP